MRSQLSFDQVHLQLKYMQIGSLNAFHLFNTPSTESNIYFDGKLVGERRASIIH